MIDGGVANAKELGEKDFVQGGTLIAAKADSVPFQNMWRQEL
jgi:hypothetical protein